MSYNDQGNGMFEGLVRKFLYYPTRLPEDAPLPPEAAGAREVWVRTTLGDTIHALYWGAPVGRPTLLYLHGNAQTVFEWCLVREELERLECGLLLIDYPGYGKSTGLPSERALYAAGDAAYGWLLENEGLSESSIVLLGKSLGGGVATELACNRRPLGLILESTFSSIPAVIRKLVPILPQNSLLKEERYASIEKIVGLRCPLFVIHGDHDDLIPMSEGVRLYEAAPEPKELWIVRHADHNDVSMIAGPEYGERLRAWIDRIIG